MFQQGVSKFWIFLLVCLAVHQLQAGEFRKFTSVEGSVIVAELLEASESCISLRRDDGIIFKDVPLARFSEYDRHYIEIWISKSGISGRPPIYRVEVGGSPAGSQCYCSSRWSYDVVRSEDAVIFISRPVQVPCRRHFISGVADKFTSGIQVFGSNGKRVLVLK